MPPTSDSKEDGSRNWPPVETSYTVLGRPPYPCCTYHLAVEWMKKVEGAKWEAQRPADKSEAAQAERMAQLEKERMALAKTVNDLELVLQQEESTYNQLLERLTEIRRRMEALETERSSITDHKIRAAVYKDLGLSWAMDDLGGLATLEDWKSRPLKCRIVAHRSNDVFTLSLPPAATPSSNAFEDASRIWQLLGK